MWDRMGGRLGWNGSRAGRQDRIMDRMEVWTEDRRSDGTEEAMRKVLRMENGVRVGIGNKKGLGLETR